MAPQIEGKNQHVPKGVVKRPALLPVDTAPRVLLVFFAILVHLLACLLSGVGYALNGAAFWLAGMVFWVVWFIIMFFIVAPRTDTLLQSHQGWLKRGAVTIFIILLVTGIAEGIIIGLFSSWYLHSGTKSGLTQSLEAMQHGFRYNDGTALIQQASENLLEGKDPYANANIVEAFVKYGGSYDRITPLQVGRLAGAFPYPTQEQLKVIWDSALQNPAQSPPEFESQVCYPAGAFLLPAPFIAAGIKDIRIIYIFFMVGGLVYAAWRIPGRRRLLFIGLATISLEIWNGLAIGETGSIIFPFLLIAWVSLGENNWLSAIFMGLAVTTKQTAWFFLPFYLILMWRTTEPKKVAEALGIIAGIFVAANAYFIARDPALWMQSVASPMTEPMFPLGVGIISLVSGDFLNIQTSLPFTIMEVVVFIGAAVWYIRNCRSYPDAGLILSMLPLFFAWRSLWTYFFYVTIIIVTRMLMRDENKLPTSTTPTVSITHQR